VRREALKVFAILGQRAKIHAVDERVEMPGVGADIPNWGAKIHRRGALKALILAGLCDKRER